MKEFLVTKKYTSGPLRGYTWTRLLITGKEPPKVGDIRVLSARSSVVYLAVEPFQGLPVNRTGLGYMAL